MDQFANSPQGIALTYFLLIWSLFWKGIALWRSAKLGQKNWFIILLILNTVGIVEILYLFRFASKRLSWQEFQSYFQMNSYPLKHLTSLRTRRKS